MWRAANEVSDSDFTLLFSYKYNDIKQTSYTQCSRLYNAAEKENVNNSSENLLSYIFYAIVANRIKICFHKEKQ